MEQPKAMEYGSRKASPDVLKPCVYVCMYVCMYVYVYVYIYIHTHTYIHTHIHTHIHTVLGLQHARHIQLFGVYNLRNLNVGNPIHATKLPLLINCRNVTS